MISKRLETIASMIPPNKVVFDVGSDHALLPCFLVRNHISNKVYAGDNKVGPLNSAKTNIDTYGLGDKITTVLSDGLDKVKDDVNVVVISGMGYHTAIDILEKADLNKFELIIVQVNKNVDLLRKYISDNNYTIVDEKIVYEDFYYEIVAFNTNKHISYSNSDIYLGPILSDKKEDLYIDYLKNKKTTINKIVDNSKILDHKNEVALKYINDYLNDCQ